ncbi:hypothetical protein L1887_59139 [Cichorium endivia]|nr:hypothetical protein L1887_59139 [Cichorium endivia]
MKSDSASIRSMPRPNALAYPRALNSLSSNLCGRFDGSSGSDHRFAKGMTPWNKGVKGLPSVGRMATTQFKAGNRPRELAPDWQPAHNTRRVINSEKSLTPATHQLIGKVCTSCCGKSTTVPCPSTNAPAGSRQANGARSRQSRGRSCAGDDQFGQGRSGDGEGSGRG